MRSGLLKCPELQCDQEKQGYCADSNKMNEFVKENDFIGWYETSAKDNINIDDSAKGLVGQVSGEREGDLVDVGNQLSTLADPAERPEDSVGRGRCGEDHIGASGRATELEKVFLLSGWQVLPYE